MGKLKEEISLELTTITPQRGRQILSEANIITFPGWDMIASFIFDSMLHYENKDFKLDIQGINDVYVGSRFDQNEEAFLLWALYPPNKRLKIIDVDKAFGHMMKLKAGEVDPIVIDDVGIDISKFIKAQFVKVIKERDQYKGLYEELLKRGGQLVPQIHVGS